MPSGPGGSASDPDRIAAWRAAARAISSAARSGSSTSRVLGAGTCEITRSITPPTSLLDAGTAGSEWLEDGMADMDIQFPRSGRIPRFPL